MLLESIGLGSRNRLEFAHIPLCDCGCGGEAEISGGNFKNKEEVVELAVSICYEWDCPHTFAFVKFKNGDCVGALHIITNGNSNDEDNQWETIEFNWNDKKALSEFKNITLEREIHFAAVFEENKNGNFVAINNERQQEPIIKNNVLSLTDYKKCKLDQK